MLSVRSYYIRKDTINNVSKQVFTCSLVTLELNNYLCVYNQDGGV